jgi:hypothetical protein
MAWPRYALVLFVAAVLPSLAAAQTSIAPEAGVLVLKNGQVLEGAITRAGDYYVVSQAEGSELKLGVNDVELCCASLLEAYEFKASHVQSFSVKSRLDLAKWCLRQGLIEECTEQLAVAANIDPTNPQVAELKTRLKLMQETPEPVVATAAPGNAAGEMENALRNLPRGSVEKFGAVIQPILLNRCGANQCHGPNAKSEFRLLRPPMGQIASRRFTQRNLYSSLKYLDRASPDNSPLVLMPQQRHGSSLAAVFDKHSSNQLAELISWARLTAGAQIVSQPAAQPVSAPATIAPVNATLSQPTGKVGGIPATAADSAEPPAAPTVGTRVMRPPLEDVPLHRSKIAAPPLPEFRDRFDPEIFNRKYHAK